MTDSGLSLLEAYGDWKIAMNWEAIGALGETVGALAVLVTLVYLAMQIRQNTKTVQAAKTEVFTDHIL